MENIAGKLSEADDQIQEALDLALASDDITDEDKIMARGAVGFLRLFSWSIAYAGSRIADEMANFTRIYGNRAS